MSHRLQAPNTELCRVLIQRLSELEADRARVLRHLSHELKTPLAALREGVALLQEQVLGALSPEQREVLVILDHNVRALQRQVEDLLNYHATVFDVVRTQVQRVALRDLLAAAVAEQQLQAQKHELRIVVGCAVAYARLDPDKTRMALANLLSNAIAFSPPGGEIRLQVECGTDAGHSLFFDCIDQGPGVAAADIDRIFDPFVQGKRRPHKSDTGSGVGLSLVREAAIAQGGRAYLVPSATGAHFRMEIPYED